MLTVDLAVPVPTSTVAEIPHLKVFAPRRIDAPTLKAPAAMGEAIVIQPLGHSMKQPSICRRLFMG